MALVKQNATQKAEITKSRNRHWANLHVGPYGVGLLTTLIGIISCLSLIRLLLCWYIYAALVCSLLDYCISLFYNIALIKDDTKLRRAHNCLAGWQGLTVLSLAATGCRPPFGGSTINLTLSPSLPSWLFFFVEYSGNFACDPPLTVCVPSYWHKLHRNYRPETVLPVPTERIW